MPDDDLKRLLDTIRQENATAHEETRRHFGVLVEGMETKIDTVADGVVSVNERIVRLEATMKEEFAEVRAMIKFSHSELDRRLRTLEEIVLDLQGRVERLESSSTH
jgi:hypothetical protein